MKFMKEYIDKLQKEDLVRQLNDFMSPQKPYTVVNGKKVLLMASNSYLGLAEDERLIEASIFAMKEYGVCSGGSRLTTGNYQIHRKLEKKIAEFKGTEDALIYNTGYMANLGVISAICNKDWIIFSDELNHASIIDGCRLSNAKIVVYKHCDINDLQEKIKLFKGDNRIIITDGVFSMDGDIAPLKHIVNIAKENNILTMVDDAHATGVLGENGSGTVEYFNLKGQVDIQIGTLSKALSSEGGYVAGSHTLIKYLIQKSRSFIYSTALSPSTVAIALKALEIVKEDKLLRKNLLLNSKWFQQQLINLGFNVLSSETPIIPVIIGDSKKAVSFSKELLKRGIYIPAIRPPSVLVGTSRLRITLMASHSKKDLQFVIDAFKEIKNYL